MLFFIVEDSEIIKFEGKVGGFYKSYLPILVFVLTEGKAEVRIFLLFGKIKDPFLFEIS